MADFNFGDYGPKDKGYLGPNKFKKKNDQPDLRVIKQANTNQSVEF